MQINEWINCFPSNWKGLIVPEAFEHPAKFSSKLITKIYAHLKEEGWIKHGDFVADPFGGVALGALEAMRNGLNWVGVELEPHWAEIGNLNIAKWQLRFSGHLPNWGRGMLIQGDSIHFSDIVHAASTVISSPPYSPNALGHAGQTDIDNSKHLYTRSEQYGNTPGNLARLPEGSIDLAISSPPYAGMVNPSGEGPGSTGERHGNESATETAYKSERVGYGNSPGNLSVMPEGDVNLIVSSPPYAGVACGGAAAMGLEREGRMTETENAVKAVGVNYGSTPGNLSIIPEGDLNLVVSSPPYTNVLTNDPKGFTPYSGPGHYQYSPEVAERRKSDYGHSEGNLADLPEGDPNPAVSSPPHEKQQVEGRLTVKQVNGDPNKCYPSWSPDRKTAVESAENLGNKEGQTFWGVSKTIVEQVYRSLAPGGIGVWVCKGYVKKGKLIDFPGQWRALCESVGFVTLHEHHALLSRHRGTSITLAGDMIEHKTSYKSFFRNHAEKNGAPPIDFETVYCMVKPALVESEAGSGIELSVSSPPYTGVVPASERPNKHTQEYATNYGHIGSEALGQRSYGSTPGNIGNLPEGNLNLAVSSPPYSDIKVNDKSRVREEYRGVNSQNNNLNYGVTPGQLAALPTGDAPKSDTRDVT